MRRTLVIALAAALLLSGCKAATGPFFSAGAFTACIARATDAAGQPSPLAHGRTYVVWGNDCTNGALAENGPMRVAVHLYRFDAGGVRQFCGSATGYRGYGLEATATAGIEFSGVQCDHGPGFRWQAAARGMVEYPEGSGNEIWSDWHWAEVEEQTSPPAGVAAEAPSGDRADDVFRAAYPNVFGVPPGEPLFD